MKHLPSHVLFALILSLGVARADSAQNQATQKTTIESYRKRLKVLQDAGDLAAIRLLAQKWEKVPMSPPDVTPYLAEADAVYKLGDIDEALRLWRALMRRKTSSQLLIYRRLLTLNKIRSNFPTLKLKPMRFARGEASREASQWRAKGITLLAAQKYDEIEKTATSLQSSNDANIMGAPYLGSFFHGLLSTPKGGSAALQTRIEAWRAARPQSNLARLAAIQMWTNAAREARGEGVASTITSSMTARMDAALQKGAKMLTDLPKKAFESPLAFDVGLNWVLIAGASRESADELFAAGIAKFPNYQPLYADRAYHLLPRWFGEPGEAEAMLKQKADEIGGENGDIFYARIVSYLSSFVGDLASDSKFDYDRAQRGLKALTARFPDSISVSSARLGLACLAGDPDIAQPIFIGLGDRPLDTSWRLWSTPINQSRFAEYRMTILAEPIP